ncbi:hypothetical protein ASO20_02730 [Mycoplasma sp. (ex Biomphalaria glabrata)]|uniref:peroxiredoxin n=1 Tax=Mycoplasma sp. (ex Biomphalaria glabrata) TaxID=1749074 RepID=UPI00073A6B9D|nr:peroxiredoxin [Mycoplasma sp. (ex Biomphalaria glabrata)]ALV23550.1 hypothetical protein ASO20_02730 [Mycoplasma sp. (ex Biomphalaria glabrata)]
MENKISIEILAHKLLGSDQKEHCLNDYKGKYIVLYFYPMDNTPGCTIQGHKYTELLSKFEELNAVVIGVSKGNAAKKEGFAQKECYKHLLLADHPELVLSKYFGVTGKVFGLISRSSFIISPDQEIIFSNKKVDHNDDAQINYDFLKNHK